MNKNQKDVIIEIIRLINQYLKLCFPQISSQKFLESFNHIVIEDPNYDGKKKRMKHLKNHNSTISNDVENDAKKNASVSHQMQARTLLDEKNNYLTGTEIENQGKKPEDQHYPDVFRIGTNGLIIPFEKLDDVTNLKSVDLTYFQAKCREILKNIYDNSFKNHQYFSDLKNYLLKDEMQQNLVKQVFLGGVGGKI